MASIHNSVLLFLGLFVVIKGADHLLSPGIGGGSEPKNEIVMVPGMRISATTSAGRITITALDKLTRSYIWDGATRTAELWPRTERWYGSLGLYFPGPGDHWPEHRGITRGVLEEGQQHFTTATDALKWIRARTWMPFVYRDDGLLVGWGKTLPRRQLNVEVWQILIAGKKPKKLAGSTGGKITVSRVNVSVDPLVSAVLKNDVARATALLAKGADPNTMDAAGLPVIVIAAKRGHADMLQVPLKGGASAEVRDSSGSNSLLEAAAAGHVKTAETLLAAGANVEAAHKMGLEKGMTPLLIAVTAGHVEVVKLLLRKGANVNVRTDLGLTPLKMATLQKETEIIRLLKEAGASQ